MLNSVSKTYRSLVLQFTAWLIFAGVAGTLTFMVWVASAVKPTTKNSLNNDSTTVIDPNILLVNHNPNEMHKLVQPITFDAIIRDKRNYPKEFKDSRFIKENLNRWTMQVMNVDKHEVITNYLSTRTDRDRFNYFRIIDEHNQKRFILTYGIFNTTTEALNTAKVTDFNLPKDVSPFPEEFKLYASQMDEYEISPPLQDIGKDAPKSVNLNRTNKELSAKSSEPKPEPIKPQNSIENSTDMNDTLRTEEKKSPLMPNRMFAYTESTAKPKENPLIDNPPPNKVAKTDNLAKPMQPSTATKPVEKPSPKKHMEENNDNPDLPVPIPQENL